MKLQQKQIKGQTYLFNKNGVMLTGLYYLGASDIKDGEVIEGKKVKKELMTGYDTWLLLLYRR